MSLLEIGTQALPLLLATISVEGMQPSGI
uniref:Uncharacterized protein n=1 Tax=Rhizophora mucronata TaxID=61149 RepID=A0A2P2NCL7_RHIMU